MMRMGSAGYDVFRPGYGEYAYMLCRPCLGCSFQWQLCFSTSLETWDTKASATWLASAWLSEQLFIPEYKLLLNLTVMEKDRVRGWRNNKHTSTHHSQATTPES